MSFDMKNRLKKLLGMADDMQNVEAPYLEGQTYESTKGVTSETPAKTTKDQDDRGGDGPTKQVDNKPYDVPDWMKTMEARPLQEPVSRSGLVDAQMDAPIQDVSDNKAANKAAGLARMKSRFGYRGK